MHGPGTEDHDAQAGALMTKACRNFNTEANISTVWYDVRKTKGSGRQTDLTEIIYRVSNAPYALALHIRLNHLAKKYAYLIAPKHCGLTFKPEFPRFEFKSKGRCTTNVASLIMCANSFASTMITEHYKEYAVEDW